MNLEDAKIVSFKAIPPAVDKVITREEALEIAKNYLMPQEGVVVDDDTGDDNSEVVCLRCKVEGSQPLPNNTCDVCGAAWESSVEEDDDFDIALELLKQAVELISQLLGNQKVVHKMSFHVEQKARGLVTTMDDFLDTYSFDETSNE